MSSSVLHLLLTLASISLSHSQNVSYSSNGKYMMPSKTTTLQADDARQFCQQQYASELASIHSEQQQQEAFMLCMRIMGNNTETIDGCFIGLNDKSNERIYNRTGWTYFDNTPYDYQNWYPNEPNEHSGGTEDCVGLIIQRGGQWNDMKCNDRTWGQMSFLCNVRTNNPSVFPTVAPTSPPSNDPTPFPTLAPTSFPSAHISYNPTLSPTFHPGTDIIIIATPSPETVASDAFATTEAIHLVTSDASYDDGNKDDGKVKTGEDDVFSDSILWMIAVCSLLAVVVCATGGYLYVYVMRKESAIQMGMNMEMNEDYNRNVQKTSECMQPNALTVVEYESNNAVVSNEYDDDLDIMSGITLGGYDVSENKV